MVELEAKLATVIECIRLLAIHSTKIMLVLSLMVVVLKAQQLEFSLCLFKELKIAKAKLKLKSMHGRLN